MAALAVLNVRSGASTSSARTGPLLVCIHSFSAKRQCSAVIRALLEAASQSPPVTPDSVMGPFEVLAASEPNTQFSTVIRALLVTNRPFPPAERPETVIPALHVLTHTSPAKSSGSSSVMSCGPRSRSSQFHTLKIDMVWVNRNAPSFSATVTRSFSLG